MKPQTMLRVLLLLALTCCACNLQIRFNDALPRANPAHAGMSSARLDRLSDALSAYVDQGRLPGGVALVVRNGTVVHEQAFGHRDREAGDTMEVDDIFRIASQTKAIVSTGVMILQEEGRLLISDHVGKYLPEYQETTVAVADADADSGYAVVPANRPITIRDLLTHTAGIDYGYGVAKDHWEQAGISGWYFADREEPIRETVKRMATLPFHAQPGEQWVYGYATDILGALIEVVSGQPLDQFLDARVFGPLGMSDTHFYLPPAKRERLAVVYSVTESGGLSRTAQDGGSVSQGAYVDGPRVSFSGGAGLLSTADDYATFLQMLLNGGELDGTRILSRKSVELMTANHIGDKSPMFFGNGMGFGLGFSVVQDLGARGSLGSTGEYGWGGAYHSVYWVDPAEELVVVYFTQVLPATGLNDHARLRALVYQAIID